MHTAKKTASSGPIRNTEPQDYDLVILGGGVGQRSLPGRSPAKESASP
jgi:hypothetical protein